MRKSLLFTMILLVGIIGGLSAQTIKMVKDIHPSSASYPRDLTAYRSGLFPYISYQVFFAAADNSHGRELWITDGTEGGTRMVKDINPDGSSNPSYPTLVPNLLLSGSLYFSADDGVHERELWISNGTEASTRMVYDNGWSGGSNPGNLTAFNGKLIFAADWNILGREIAITDGTTSGSKLIEDINPGTNSSNPSYLKLVNGKVWFSADDGIDGAELWVTDGTEANTNMIKNINTHTSGEKGSNPRNFTEYNGKVYFSADDGSYGTQLYVSDGTTAGTQMVKRIGPSSGSYPEDLMVYNGLLYFSALESTGNQVMFRTNGTTAGTEVFPAKQESEKGYNRPIIIYNNRLYFWMRTETSGVEFWSTDGTEEGTRMLRDINPGTGSSSPGYWGIAIMDDLLYFAAINDDQQNSQVWVTDGSTSGTKMIMPDIAPLGMPLYHNREFLVWGGNLYFSASYTPELTELWKINGATSGIEELPCIDPEFTFWPNPARGELQINCSHPVTIRILDLTGRALIEKTLLQSGTLSLGGLSPGVYFISDTGNKTVRKLVVE